MSKNSPYHKSNYSNNNVHSSINRKERDKSMSISPYKGNDTAKTKVNNSSIRDQFTRTQNKRNYQNEEQNIQHIPRSLYQQRTNKKTSYGQGPHQVSNTYANIYQGAVSNNKVQMIKQQNIYLVQENKQLNQLLNQKNKIISSLQKKLQHQIQQQVVTLQQIQMEKNRFLADYHGRDDQQRIQIQRLILQLEQVNLQKREIQNANKYEIQILKKQFTQQNRHLIDNVIFRTQKDLKVKQLQLNSFRQRLQKLNLQLKQQQEAHKAESQHLQNNISKLLEQLELVNHQKKVQLSQQKIAFQNIISSLNREKEQQVQNTIFKYEVELKKIKNLFNQKLLQKNNLEHEIQTAKLQHSNNIQELLQRQTALKNQIIEIELFYQQLGKRELQKQKKLNYNENEITLKATQLNNRQFSEQIQKLLSVNKQKSVEIQNLYMQIQKVRQECKNQIQRIQKVNSELRQKLAEFSQSSEEETEMLKIKMGELRHADLLSLKKYYENELASKSQQIIDLQKMVKDNRQKLHKQLEERILEKKKYEYLIDEYRIKTGELELKIAIMIEEHKQKVQSLGSQIEMTSMTLIRQSTHKQKYSFQAQMQKKKLQQIIVKKDQEIEELNTKINMMKKNHLQQIEQKEAGLKLLNQKNQNLDNQIKRQREFYMREISKKQQAKKETKEFYEGQILKEKQSYSKQLREATQKLTQQKKELTVQLQHLRLVEKQQREEHGIHAEHHEQKTIEKQVSHNQERARLQYAKESLQINLKNYYQKKIEQIQSQLQITKQQLAEKSQDLRNMAQKNYKMQKKMDKIMESQQKMRVLEEKVMAIGQQNNIVKNISEIGVIKSRRRII